MTKERACANTPALSRRMVLTSLPMSALALGAIGNHANAAPAGAPFLAPIAGEPDLLALCYPKSKIDHGYCYMLENGTTIRAEGARCQDPGSHVWRDILPGEFDGRVIGRVVSVHRNDGDRWHDFTSAYV